MRMTGITVVNENKKEPSLDGKAQDTHWRSYITILYIENQAIIEKPFKFLARERVTTNF